MDYLLKSSTILGLFYLFYKFVLQRETFFQSNRLFLLAGIFSALIIPLIVVPIYVEQTSTTAVLKGFVITENGTISEIQKTIDWLQILLIVYISGVLFFGGKFILSLISLSQLLISSTKEKVGDFYFIKNDKETSPFSFFNYIVYNHKPFKQQELQQIIAHEKVHAYQWHSFDVLLSQIITIIFWFNPFSWLYKKELQQNLEFIADAISQEKTACEKSYQKLLLKTSIEKNPLALTNNFYNSLIKKRILMLHKNKSKRTNQWKFALILPLIIAFVLTFNTEAIAQTETTVKISSIEFIEDSEEKNTNEKTEFKNLSISTSFTKDSKKEVFDRFEKMFKKGFLKEEFGTIIVKFSDLNRNNKGEITAIKINVNSETTTANYSTRSNTPIKPIKITVGNNGKGISISTMGAKIPSVPNPLITIATAADEKNSLSGTNENTLYFIDDKEVSKEKLDELSPKNIESISVLKGEAATKLYGKKAKDGVVLITTKKK